jgi:hypothetical protein
MTCGVTGYRAEDICAELQRRGRAGEDLNQHFFIGGCKFSFTPGTRDPRSRLREGSQRWLALRNVHTTRALMKEMQHRISRGDYVAWFEWRSALGCGVVQVSWKR